MTSFRARIRNLMRLFASGQIGYEGFMVGVGIAYAATMQEEENGNDRTENPWD